MPMEVEWDLQMTGGDGSHDVRRQESGNFIFLGSECGT